jgi:hypothetical protein
LSSDTEDYADLSVAHLSSRNIHNQKWKRAEVTTKTARSFKMSKSLKGVPFKKSEQRSSTTVRNNENALIGTTLHRSLRKKICTSKRGNLENLEGECYISFQKLLSNELRSMDRKDSYLFDIAMRISRLPEMINCRTKGQATNQSKKIRKKTAVKYLVKPSGFLERKLDARRESSKSNLEGASTKWVLVL